MFYSAKHRSTKLDVVIRVTQKTLVGDHQDRTFAQAARDEQRLYEKLASSQLSTVKMVERFEDLANTYLVTRRQSHGSARDYL